ncbi:MAG: hypothetical protein ACJAZS_000270 [Alteromonas naphthalenivorans]|jgi:hypothetical protein
MWCASVHSIMFQEFLYPVAVITHDGKEKICVLYQKDSHLELWFWDPESLEAVKGLLSSFTPAGIRILSHKKAFSFIDNDRIRIKDIAKRSPRTLDLPYGPYDLTTIEWIDSESFYFCARQRGCLNLFHATIEGELFYLTRDTLCNYMYPQKIEESLFYLTKDDEGEMTIEQAEYPLRHIPQRSWNQEKQDFQEQLKKVFEEENDLFSKTYLDPTTKKQLYVWKDTSKELAFLSMKNKHKGYFLTHPININKNDEHMTFECYTFSCQQDVQVKKLFDFSIPLHLLMPQRNYPERLYESILPLLPLYHQDAIYYSHDSGTGLRLYKYSEKTGVSEELTNDHDGHHFSPLCYGNKIYYGGSVSHDDDTLTSPHMWINEHGETSFEFPEINTSNCPE